MSVAPPLGAWENRMLNDGHLVEVKPAISSHQVAIREVDQHVPMPASTDQDVHALSLAVAHLSDQIRDLASILAQVRAEVQTLRALERGLAARIARLESERDCEKEVTNG
jgi:hypothetical protein